MKNKCVAFIIAFFSGICLSISSFAQVPKLGATENFALFTTTGAVSNTGISIITGNIGTNVGAITNYTFVAGQEHIADSVTQKCADDLLLIYHYIDSLVPTQLLSSPLGSGQILNAGVYLLGEASALNLDLTLDGQGNSEARFIFKITGAFSTGAGAKVNLINGASACNVFWQAEGAVALATGTYMRGTVIANNGAISMAASDTLEGRLLSTTGAIATDALTANIPLNCSALTLPIQLFSFTGACYKQMIELKWKTATETNNLFFTVERSNDAVNWDVLGTIPTEGNGSRPHFYSYYDKWSEKLIAYYRLKQTDIDGNYKYSAVILIKKCETVENPTISLYPNPTSGVVSIDVNGDRRLIQSTEIFNNVGHKIFESNGLPLTLDLTGQTKGTYFIRFHQGTKVINRKLIVR